jgi:hypothetical protein
VCVCVCVSHPFNIHSYSSLSLSLYIHTAVVNPGDYVAPVGEPSSPAHSTDRANTDDNSSTGSTLGDSYSPHTPPPSPTTPNANPDPYASGSTDKETYTAPPDTTDTTDAQLEALSPIETSDLTFQCTGDIFRGNFEYVYTHTHGV